jgi:hypothetical protein
MLGPSRAPCFSAKAKETESLVPFTVYILERFQHKFNELSADEQHRTSLLIAAGKAAVSFMNVLNRVDGTPVESQQQLMLDLYLRHMALASDAGMKLMPKHHAMVHMIQRCGALGHPRTYSTYKDESINGVVACIARSAHSWTFAATVHRKYGAFLALD